MKEEGREWGRGGQRGKGWMGMVPVDRMKIEIDFEVFFRQRVA
jgi:hypothetical protein